MPQYTAFMHLVLNSFGSSLGVKNGLFAVTHADGSHTIPPDKVKTISIRKGIRLSSNAIYLAIEHEIDVLFLDKSGKPFGRVWSNKFGSISTIRRNQVDWSRSVMGARWIRKVIIHKIENQAALLAAISVQLVPENLVASSISKLNTATAKIAELPDLPIEELAARIRGLEGHAGKVYWAIMGLALPEKFQFAERSQHPATDAFNCLINYAYGMLYGIIEGELIKAGIDPYLGVLHRDEYNRPTLVYDFIEQYRVWADFVVIDLCQQQAIGLDSFLEENGGFWLEGYGKRILVQCFNDYLDEVVDMNKIARSRRNHIAFQAQKLMRSILNFDSEADAKNRDNTD